MATPKRTTTRSKKAKPAAAKTTRAKPAPKSEGGDEPAKEIKETILHIRVTEAQKKALELAAAREGHGLSAWVRALALKAAGALPT